MAKSHQITLAQMGTVGSVPVIPDTASPRMDTDDRFRRLLDLKLSGDNCILDAPLKFLSWFGSLCSGPSVCNTSNQF